MRALPQFAKRPGSSQSISFSAGKLDNLGTDIKPSETLTLVLLTKFQRPTYPGGSKHNITLVTWKSFGKKIVLSLGWALKTV